jgi:hypothetical protein
MNNIGYFNQNQIPKEITRIIFSYLKPGDLIAASLVSQGFRKLAEDWTLWRDIAMKTLIPLSNEQTAKKDLNDYCKRYTQLFKRIFPEIKLSHHLYEQYELLKSHIEAQQNNVQPILQSYLNSHLKAASPETVAMLIQAGAKIQDSPIKEVIETIKAYSLRNSHFYRNVLFSRPLPPMPVEETLAFNNSLKNLEIYIKAGGKIKNSKTLKLLVTIALKYHCFSMAQALLKKSILSIRGLESDFLSVIITSKDPFRQQDLPYVKAIIQMLINAGAHSDRLESFLNKLGIESIQLSTAGGA